MCSLDVFFFTFKVMCDVKKRIIPNYFETKMPLQVSSNIHVGCAMNHNRKITDMVLSTMYLLTEWEGWTGKHLAWGQDVWRWCCWYLKKPLFIFLQSELVQWLLSATPKARPNATEVKNSGLLNQISLKISENTIHKSWPKGQACKRHQESEDASWEMCSEFFWKQIHRGHYCGIFRAMWLYVGALTV